MIHSSGNVFLDLGFPPDEAATLLLRAKLMTDLCQFLTTGGLTQTEAATRLGISQSRVSDLVRGKWEKFSLDMLVTLATRAGLNVSMKLAA